MARDALVAEQIRPLAARVAESLGLEVFDVQFRREGAGMVLRVQLDRPGPASTAEESVSVDDCARVSRDLSALLDVEDIVPTAYTLEVSSPGLDRPLRGLGDFQRFKGRRVKLVVKPPIDGQGYFKGRIGDVEAGRVAIETDDGRTHQVPVDLIMRANLEVDF